MSIQSQIYFKRFHYHYFNKNIRLFVFQFGTTAAEEKR